MRRLLPLLLLTLALPLGASASASCPNPEEGSPPCCPPQYLVEIDNGVVYLGVPHPIQPPCY